MAGALSWASALMLFGGSMLNSEDYKELSNRFARLAIESGAPSVSEALLAMALDYASRAARAHPRPSGQQLHDQVDGFGD